MLGLISGKTNWPLVPPHREMQTSPLLFPFPGSSFGEGVSGMTDTKTTEWCSPTKIPQPLPQWGTVTRSLTRDPTTTGSSPQVSVGRAGAGRAPAGYFDTWGEFPAREVPCYKILNISLNVSHFPACWLESWTPFPKKGMRTEVLYELYIKPAVKT